MAEVDKSKEVKGLNVYYEGNVYKIQNKIKWEKPTIMKEETIFTFIEEIGDKRRVKK